MYTVCVVLYKYDLFSQLIAIIPCAALTF